MNTAGCQCDNVAQRNKQQLLSKLRCQMYNNTQENNAQTSTFPSGLSLSLFVRQGRNRERDNMRRGIGVRLSKTDRKEGNAPRGPVWNYCSHNLARATRMYNSSGLINSADADADIYGTRVCAGAESIPAARDLTSPDLATMDERMRVFEYFKYLVRIH